MANPFFVFLPGTLCDERVFIRQSGIFAPHAFVDLRSPETVEEMIDAVASIPVQQMVLVGFSMGGHVAQEFSIKHPERVDKLIVISASSEGYPPEEKRIVRSALPAMERGSFRGITDHRLRSFLHPSSYANEELRALIHAMAGDDAKEVYLRQVRATLDRSDLKSELKSVKFPVLFVGGTDDRIVPIDSIRRSAENIPGAKFLSIPDCGHFVPLEKPETLNSAIQNFTQT